MSIVFIIYPNLTFNVPQFTSKVAVTNIHTHRNDPMMVSFSLFKYRTLKMTFQKVFSFYSVSFLRKLCELNFKVIKNIVFSHIRKTQAVFFLFTVLFSSSSIISVKEKKSKTLSISENAIKTQKLETFRGVPDFSSKHFVDVSFLH